MNLQELARHDPEIAGSIELEEKRQRSKLELIASENFTSEAVRFTMGSVLTHKYAEGYPGKRYYGGCEFVDMAEDLARDRARKLFSAQYANVQPHSGSQANMAVYFGVLKPGDTILGMDLSHGGHLTHGSPVNFSGKFYTNVFYRVDKNTGRLDYDQIEALAMEHKPALIIAGASAYPRTIDFARFRAIADAAGSRLMVDMAHIAGLIAAGHHPSPVPYAHAVTSTTHKTLRGPRGGLILGRAGLDRVLNKEIFPGIQGGPLMHVIAAKAVAFRIAKTPSFVDYQARVVKNARTLADVLQKQGVDLISGGTDNHMMLADLRSLGITGKKAEESLGMAGITVNKNAVPFDTESPFVTSGIRIGTPAVTTRGMREAEMEEIGSYIADVLKHPDDTARLDRIRRDVENLCSGFPLFEGP